MQSNNIIKNHSLMLRPFQAQSGYTDVTPVIILGIFFNS